MKKFVLSLFLLSFTLGLVAAPSVLIRETIEVAAKVSGKSLSRSAGRTAQKALQNVHLCLRGGGCCATMAHRVHYSGALSCHLIQRFLYD